MATITDVVIHINGDAPLPANKPRVAATKNASIYTSGLT